MRTPNRRAAQRFPHQTCNASWLTSEEPTGKGGDLAVVEEGGECGRGEGAVDPPVDAGFGIDREPDEEDESEDEHSSELWMVVGWDGFGCHFEHVEYQGAAGEKAGLALFPSRS